MAQSAAAPGARRNILLAVDDTEASERACQWLADNLLRDGDEVRLFHVVPLPHADASLGSLGGAGSGVDEVLNIGSGLDPELGRQHVADAEAFISEKFVPRLKGAAHKLEVVRFKTDADSVGEVLCQRAADLKVVALVMASHNKGAVQRFFLGSASTHCMQHCEQPLVVLH